MYTPPVTTIDRRTNFILKNSDAYQSDAGFRAMVDNTVYLSQEERVKSAVYIDDFYGTSYALQYKLEGRDV
jgi:hypothetical protein